MCRIDEWTCTGLMDGGTDRQMGNNVSLAHHYHDEKSCSKFD